MVHKRSLGQNTPQQPRRKKRKISQVPEATTPLRLKIQRLRGDDFFISISKTDIVTKLKQQVLRVLRSTTSPEVCVENTNIRLIYKGKVLVDEKSIEFYRMQNEDTIQLVPFQLSRSSSLSGSDFMRQPSRRTESHVLNELPIENYPINIVTISTSFMGEPSRAENRSTARISNELRRAANHPMPFRRSAASTRPPPRPVTSSSLRSFKDILQRTHLRVHLAEQQMLRRGSHNEQRALLSQLQLLVRRSLSLRDDLLTEFQSQSTNGELPRRTFQATSENGVFSVVSRQQGTPEHNASARSVDEEKTNNSQTEEKKEENLSRSITTTSHPHSNSRSPSFVLQRTGEFDIPERNLTSPSDIRVRQNSQSPHYRHLLHLSRANSTVPSRTQRGDPLHSFFSSIVINSSSSNQSQSIITNGRTVANATTESVGQSGDQQQSLIRTSSSSIARTPAPTPVSTQVNLEQNSEQPTTAGSRLRNIFNQFLNRFIN